jgi:hypothetical protein
MRSDGSAPVDPKGNLMGIKSIVVKTAVVLLGVTALAAPSAAWANQLPPPGGGAAECYPYVTSIAKSGSSLKWTVRVYSCPYDSNFLIENDYWDHTHESGPGGEPDTECLSNSGCTFHLTESISGHTGDTFCAASVVEEPLPVVGGLLSGGELCT